MFRIGISIYFILIQWKIIGKNTNTNRTSKKKIGNTKNNIKNNNKVSNNKNNAVKIEKSNKGGNDKDNNNNDERNNSEAINAPYIKKELDKKSQNENVIYNNRYNEYIEKIKKISEKN